MVELLLEHGANPSPEGIDCIAAIHIAAEKGYVRVCEILLSATSRSQAAEDMIMAMWIVLSSCDLPIIEAMIERCGRFYSREAEEKFGLRNDHSLLSKITERGCSESAIRAFIQVGARDILEEERSALRRAVLRGDPRIVELLLHNGVNATN